MSSVSAPRVLLIGGLGFIGQHLTRACRLVGLTVRVADVVRPKVDAIQEGVEYIQGDYGSPSFLRVILEGADIVVHMAHDSILINSDCNMDIEFERNIRPAMRLMDSCIHMGISKLLFLSSGGTVYGNHSEHSPITEESSTHPISLYGTSKLMIEQIGFLYHVQKGLPFLVARPSNAYGPGQFPFRGQGFVATAFASALEGRPLNIFGDGSVVRDFIHVRDIADALLSLVRNGYLGNSYNIGTAQAISIRTLVEKYISPIIEEDGFELLYQYTTARGVDVAYNVVTNSKLFRDTGFVPEISLDEGLRETWAWLKTHYIHWR